MRDTIFHILFVWYPYVCISAFVFGSLIRFDREQYTWKASSSQLLRKRQLFWGSNLFHFGILFLFFGHTVGLLTPKAIYTLFVTVEQKQLLAIIAGGIAGTDLLRRPDAAFASAAVRCTRAPDVDLHGSRRADRSCGCSSCLGLVTLPFSLGHSDGEAMLRLSHWAQGIVTVQPVDAKTLQGLDWPYLVHLVLGMTIFLLFPFSRLVHIWSAPVWYLGRRGYQVVRTRRPLGRSGPASYITHPAE